MSTSGAVEANRHVTVGPVTFGNDLPIAVFAGPCQMESRAHALEMASALKEICERREIGLVYKTSFDKANRTSLSGKRGLGLDMALEVFAEIRARLGLPVVTDVHEAGQCAPVAEVVDVLQIPAFLCRQTDLLTAAASTGRSVNVKKGQWMAPEDMRHPVEKLRSSGATDIAVTERGTAFGYGRWVVDMRGFEVMRRECRCRTLFDATHSIQLPGGAADGRASGGEPGLIEPLARAAVAAGADGLFVETHPHPANAPSDGANMLPLARLEPLVEGLLRVRSAIRHG